MTAIPSIATFTAPDAPHITIAEDAETYHVETYGDTDLDAVAIEAFRDWDRRGAFTGEPVYLNGGNGSYVIETAVFDGETYRIPAEALATNYQAPPTDGALV